MLEMCTKCVLSGDLRISNVPKFFAERQPSDAAAYDPLQIELDAKLNSVSWSSLFVPVVRMGELPEELREGFPSALTGVSTLWTPSDVLINGHGLRVQLSHAENPEYFEFRLNPESSRSVNLKIRAHNLREETITYVYSERGMPGSRSITLTQYLPTQKLRYVFVPIADANTELSIYQLK